jgi:hypothetical protein
MGSLLSDSDYVRSSCFIVLLFSSSAKTIWMLWVGVRLDSRSIFIMIVVVKQESLVENSYTDSSDVCCKAGCKKTSDQRLYDHTSYLFDRSLARRNFEILNWILSQIFGYIEPRLTLALITWRNVSTVFISIYIYRFLQEWSKLFYKIITTVHIYL